MFLDTSSLFKLYHREIGTTELESLFSTLKITEVFLSEISKIEFTSAYLEKSTHERNYNLRSTNNIGFV